MDIKNGTQKNPKHLKFDLSKITINHKHLSIRIKYIVKIYNMNTIVLLFFLLTIRFTYPDTVDDSKFKSLTL